MDPLNKYPFIVSSIGNIDSCEKHFIGAAKINTVRYNIKTVRQKQCVHYKVSYIFIPENELT